MESEKKKVLENRRKILEKYQELKNPARTLLSKMKEKNSPMRWSELKRCTGLPESGNYSLKSGIDQLRKFNLIEKKGNKKEGIRYSLNKRVMWQLSLIARKQSDKINLDSYNPDEIIDLQTSIPNTKTTIYGLKLEEFRKVVEESRNTDITKKETREFLEGIKAKEMFGEFFGVPQGIKIRAQRERANEKEIIDKQREHYLDLVKKGMRIVRKSDEKEKTRKKGKTIKVDEEVIKDVVEDIIRRYRDEHIKFEKASKNFTQKLLDLKKKHRYDELEDSYEEILKREDKRKLRNKVLKDFKKEFINILNHCNINREWLEETIFELYGWGRGLYSTTGIHEKANQRTKKEHENKWKRNIEFKEAVEKLENSEKDKIIDFLIKVFEKNINLYPTHVSVVCRTGSHDILPLTEPKPKKNQRKSVKYQTLTSLFNSSIISCLYLSLNSLNNSSFINFICCS